MTVEGKTKIIKEGPSANTVLMETKDSLSGGDAAKLVEIPGIGLLKTQQTINVFKLLQANDIPVAFIDQENERTMLCDACDMIPLELVVRRYGWGSYLKRNPEAKNADGTPVRFSEPKWEIFHKDAVVDVAGEAPHQMLEADARAKYLKDGVWAGGVYTDPLVQVGPNSWSLHSAKAPVDTPLMRIDPVVPTEKFEKLMGELILPAFSIIEKAWKKQSTKDGSIQLADIKFEAGYRQSDGELVIADVIDNDSWRIWPGGDPKNQLDKQAFREDTPLDIVESNYKLVTGFTDSFMS